MPWSGAFVRGPIRSAARRRMAAAGVRLHAGHSREDDPGPGALPFATPPRRNHGRHHHGRRRRPGQDPRGAPGPARRGPAAAGTRRRSAATSGRPRAARSAASRSRSPASSGRWTRRGSRRGREEPGDRDPPLPLLGADRRGPGWLERRSCYRAADGRGRAGAQPELRAAQRLQHPARVPARLRIQGRGHRVRPRHDPHRPRRLPGAVRDPPPAPGPPAAAAREADPARDLRPRPPHLPVLRPDRPRPDPGPRHAAPSRRRPLLGEPRGRVQALQPPQGRTHTRGGPPPARPVRRSSRAATSTRCSRRTSRTTATRPGATTSSSAGTRTAPWPRPRPPRERLARIVPDAGRRDPGPSPCRGARRLRRGRLAARRPAGPRARGLGPRDRRAPGPARRAVPRRRLREPVRDGRRPPRRRRLRDHHLPHRARLRRLPPAAPGGVRDGRDRRPRAARLHGQRDRLGPRGGRGRPERAGRPVRRRRRTWAAPPARGGRPGRAVPRGRAAHDPGGAAGGHAGVRHRAATRSRRSAPTPGWSPISPASGSGPSSRSCSRRRGRRSACGWPRRRGCSP